MGWAGNRMSLKQADPSKTLPKRECLQLNQTLNPMDSRKNPQVAQKPASAFGGTGFLDDLEDDLPVVQLPSFSIVPTVFSRAEDLNLRTPPH